MPLDIRILQQYGVKLDLTIKKNSIHIWVTNWSDIQNVVFDMTNKSHRQAIKKMVKALQQQLDLHEK